jgi:hypothetical protein
VESKILTQYLDTLIRFGVVGFCDTNKGDGKGEVNLLEVVKYLEEENIEYYSNYSTLIWLKSKLSNNLHKYLIKSI